MRKAGIFGLVLAAGVSLGACSTYGDNPELRGAATGAAAGAALGAGVGAVADGVSVGEGAAVGAVAGGIVGAVASDRKWHRDERGYCYYLDDGERVYDYDKRC